MIAPRIGISGWSYPRWRRKFYPAGLAHARELAFAGARFGAIEVNGSFYRLQTPATYASWAEQTPANFLFALKGPRFITHMKKLVDVDSALANFFASGVLKLGAKLGPILWQFPERFAYSPERFETFMRSLPRTHHRAAALARRHDPRLRGQAALRAEHRGRIDHAFEIRHPSFLCEEFFAQLRRHEMAFVYADTGGKWPEREVLSARDFVYVRLHGPAELYASGYSPTALAEWARRIRRWARTRQVYVFFDNDAKVHAPFDALALQAKFSARSPSGGTP